MIYVKADGISAPALVPKQRDDRQHSLIGRLIERKSPDFPSNSHFFPLFPANARASQT